MDNFSKIEIKVWTGHYEEIKTMAQKLIYNGTIPSVHQIGDKYHKKCNTMRNIQYNIDRRFKFYVSPLQINRAIQNSTHDATCL